MNRDLASLVRRAEVAADEAERLAELAAETCVQAMLARADHQLIDLPLVVQARLRALLAEPPNSAPPASSRQPGTGKLSVADGSTPESDRTVREIQGSE